MNRDRMLLGLGAALVVAILASTYVYRQLQRKGRDGRQTGSGGGGGGPAEAGPTPDGLGCEPDGLAGGNAAGRDRFRAKRTVWAVPSLFRWCKDEVILDQEVAKPEEGAGLPVTIPAGMRAVSVGVDDVVAVAGFVTPGTDGGRSGDGHGTGRADHPHHSGTRAGAGRRAAVADGKRKAANGSRGYAVW